MKQKIKRILRRVDFYFLKFKIAILCITKKFRFKYKVGLVSCDALCGKNKDDLLIQFYLLKHNIDANIVSWQDKSINYATYDALVIRTVWGIDNYKDEFINWLDSIEKQGVIIFNNVAVLKRNFDKEIQFGILKKHNIETIPTIFIDGKELKENVNNINFDNNISPQEVVIKPTFSESGKNTYRVSVNNIKTFNSIKSRIMVQPFIEEALNGEYNICCIGRRITHAVWRTSGVFSNKKTIKYIPKKNIDRSLLELASKIIDIKEYSDNLYTRIDIVHHENRDLVMEVEALDPNLFFEFIHNKKEKNKILNLFSKELLEKMNISLKKNKG